MELKIGCDIVSIKRFEQSAKNSGKEFLNRIFSASELAREAKTETLAGMFAAKEAVAKALSLKAGDWHKIEIVKNKDGRPEARLAEFVQEIVTHDLSISHDGEYAMAAAIFMLE